MIVVLRAGFPSSCLSLPSHDLPAMARLLDGLHSPFAILICGLLQASLDSYCGALDGYYYNLDI
jgi:hypothetical protein